MTWTWRDALDLRERFDDRSAEYQELPLRYAFGLRDHEVVRSARSFWVVGRPVAEPRHRARAQEVFEVQRVWGLDVLERRIRARSYPAKTAESWKQRVALYSRSHAPAQPLEGPVVVWIDFYLRRPAFLRRYLPERSIRHDVKPDRDNLDKAFLDALTRARWWLDDDQVAGGGACKWYAPTDAPGGAHVIVLQIEEVGRPIRASAARRKQRG